MKRKQILAIFFIELILLAIIASLIIPKASLKTKIDATTMNLTNYKFDYYVGTNVVKTGDIGTAKYTFTGIPAYYNLIVAYVDEDDGNSTYSVNVNSTEVDFWTADKNPKKDCLFTRTIEDVKLSNNAEIKILGTRNEGESARLAYIEIVYSHGINPLSLIKFGYESFVEFAYTTNFFILIAVLLAFTVLNITAFILLKAKMHLPTSDKLANSEKSVVPDEYSGPEKPIMSDELSHPEKPALSDELSSTSKSIVSDDSSSPTKSVMSDQSVSSQKPLLSGEAEIQGELPLIEQMTKYIDDNFADSNFTVQQMADHFNLSLNYLSSFFKEQTGQNIVYYLTNLRVERAKSLLSSSNMSVKDVAENSGYYNASSFIRRFKQLTGYTPGEYRTNNSSLQQ